MNDRLVYLVQESLHKLGSKSNACPVFTIKVDYRSLDVKKLEWYVTNKHDQEVRILWDRVNKTKLYSYLNTPS